jgi:hypothetical protein
VFSLAEAQEVTLFQGGVKFTLISRKLGIDFHPALSFDSKIFTRASKYSTAPTFTASREVVSSGAKIAREA